MGYGKKINELLQKRGITVAELSRMTNIRPTTLYSIIDNDSSDLKISVARAICDALDIPFSELTGFSMDNKLSSLLAIFPGAEIQHNPSGETILDLANLEELAPYFSLNSIGRKRALEYINELIKIPEYKCKKEDLS